MKTANIYYLIHQFEHVFCLSGDAVFYRVEFPGRVTGCQPSCEIQQDSQWCFKFVRYIGIEPRLEFIHSFQPVEFDFPQFDGVFEFQLFPAAS